MKTKLYIISVAIFMIVSAVWGVLILHHDRSWNINPRYSNQPSQTPMPASGTVKSSTLLFVGDIMLSRSVGELMAKNNNYDYPFEFISDFLNSADLTIGNLEGPISDRGTRVGSIYSFRADPKVVMGLKKAGFDVLDVANNHIWDYGRTAFLDTLNYLTSSDISYVGAGLDYPEAHKGVTKEINGVKVAFLAYTDLISPLVSAGKLEAGISFYKNDEMASDIDNLRKVSDIIIVSFHWGDEYKTTHNSKQEEVAKTAIDAGADMVIGHHPHVIQDIQKYKDKWIAYSLGNFVFDQSFSENTMKGLCLLVSLNSSNIIKVEPINVFISNQYQPSIIN